MSLSVHRPGPGRHLMHGHDRVPVGDSSQTRAPAWLFACVEALFCLSVGLREFGNQFGILRFESLSGGLIIGSAVVAVAWASQHGIRIVTPTFLLGTILALAAILSLVMLRGTDIWQSYEIQPILLMMGEIVMLVIALPRHRSRRRIAVFLSTMVLVAVYVGASQGGSRSERLQLEGVASSFANGNDLAYFAGIMAVFWISILGTLGLWMRSLAVVLAIGLLAVVACTVSRGAALTCMTALVLLAILRRPHWRMWALVVGVLAGAAVLDLAVPEVSHRYEAVRDNYAARALEDSARYEVWPAILPDLMDTLFLGRGSGNTAVTATGITPHNTFFHIHLAYGGLAAYFYLFWLLRTGARVFRNSSFAWHDSTVATLSALFVATLGCQFFSNMGLTNYGVLFGLCCMDTQLPRQALT